MTLPTTDKEAQSLRVNAGAEFEKNVAYIITDLLIHENIYASSLKNLKDAVKREPGLNQVLEFAKFPLRSPCTHSYEMILPDSDVIVYYVQKDHAGQVKKRFHLATISCKVSFHARETESAFWALALKDHGSKFVLATEDKFDELKTCEMGNKARRVLEHYMDGIYLMRHYSGADSTKALSKDISRFHEVFEKSKPSGYKRQNSAVFDEGRKSARYCKQVRPFDDLLFDLMKWKFEFEEI